jgi:hypothetical protein
MSKPASGVDRNVKSPRNWSTPEGATAGGQLLADRTVVCREFAARPAGTAAGAADAKLQGCRLPGAC